MTRATLKDYLHNGKGPLAEQRYAATMLKLNPANPSSSSRTGSNMANTPNVMIMASVNSIADHEVTEQTMQQRANMRPSFWAEYGQSVRSESRFTLMPVLVKPESRGVVRLKSSNPLDPPIVVPGYLTQDHDVRLMVAALQATLDLIRLEPFRVLGKPRRRVSVPWKFLIPFP